MEVRSALAANLRFRCFTPHAAENSPASSNALPPRRRPKTGTPSGAGGPRRGRHFGDERASGRRADGAFCDGSHHLSPGLATSLTGPWHGPKSKEPPGARLPERRLASDRFHAVGNIETPCCSGRGRPWGHPPSPTPTRSSASTKRRMRHRRPRAYARSSFGRVATSTPAFDLGPSRLLRFPLDARLAACPSGIVQKPVWPCHTAVWFHGFLASHCIPGSEPVVTRDRSRGLLFPCKIPPI